MLGAWRYIILISTIIGAVLTPSTDPLTQLLLSFAILLLYFSGVGILFLIKINLYIYLKVFNSWQLTSF